MSVVFDEWCDAWGVSAAARDDLRARYARATACSVAEDGPGTEAYVQSLVRVQAPHSGVLLWRNNVGALLDERGVPVRYGLANDSAAINKRIKSADLIGLRRVLIGPAHVGHVLGQFVSVECKAPDWKPRANDAHFAAQQEWQRLVQSWGGDARVVRGPVVW